MSEGGLPGERHRAYYEERAIGGAAMIVVEPVPVHPTAVLTRGNFRHSTDEIIPHSRKITDRPRPWHGDPPSALPCRPAWRLRQFLRAQLVALGASSFHDSDGSHRMSEAEIEEVIDAFVAAARCRAIGLSASSFRRLSCADRPVLDAMVELPRDRWAAASRTAPASPQRSSAASAATSATTSSSAWR